jgi:hypothetical protein
MLRGEKQIKICPINISNQYFQSIFPSNISKQSVHRPRELTGKGRVAVADVFQATGEPEIVGHRIVQGTGDRRKKKSVSHLVLVSQPKHQTIQLEAPQ